MKAADISDEIVLSTVLRVNESEKRWCLIWDLEESIPWAPRKVILAKCRSLIRRGWMDGCVCGCRGDFEIMGLR